MSTKRSSTRKNRPTPPKLGFIVERDLHKLCVESLARRTAAQVHPTLQPQLATIRVGDAPWQRYIFPEVVNLLARGCRRVLVVFDTNTTDAQDIASQVSTLRGPLAAAGLMDRVALIPVVPAIQRWLLMDRVALEHIVGARVPWRHPLRNDDPRAFLEELLGQEPRDKLKALLAHLELARIARRAACFTQFQQNIIEALSLEGSSLKDPKAAVT
jgi:hypothetical protein